MPPQQPPKKAARPAARKQMASPPRQAQPPTQARAPRPAPPARQVMAAVPAAQGPGQGASNNDMNLGVAVAAGGGGGDGVVTARGGGGLRDMALNVDPDCVGVPASLQHLAKAINIAFQSDYGENYLEAVYQAAVVRRGEIDIVHREYFGFGESWFGQLGMLLRSLQLSAEGPDPASPEGLRRIAERGPATIRGLLNLVGRKLDLVAEYEDRVPAYVQQMFDRLEASGIIVGWDRSKWDIGTTRIGLNIRITPKHDESQDEVPGEG